jgi:hypothetical protein
MLLLMIAYGRMVAIAFASAPAARTYTPAAESRTYLVSA